MSQFRYLSGACSRLLLPRYSTASGVSNNAFKSVGRLSSLSLNGNGRSMSTQQHDESVVAAPPVKSKFNIPQHHPSKFDRMTLIVTRTLKAADIGDEVTYEVMEKANTKRRIAVNISLMIFTFFGSMWAISQGKKAMKTDNIYEINKRR